MLDFQTFIEVFKTLLFGFCFFHADVQEGEVVVGTSAVIFALSNGCEDRRKFGPIGWNIPYGLHTGGAFSHAVSWNNFNEDHERAPVAVFCCFLVVTWRDIWSSPSVCISVIATPKNPSTTCIKTMFFSLQLVWISGFGSLPAAANAVCQQVQGEICREFLKFA